MEELLERLGDRFVGLWIYKPFSAQGTRFWFVTFRDVANNYWETDRCDTPCQALKQAIDCLARQAAGEQVNPETIG